MTRYLTAALLFLCAATLAISVAASPELSWQSAALRMLGSFTLSSVALAAVLEPGS